jgi:hypothetical protein
MGAKTTKEAGRDGAPCQGRTAAAASRNSLLRKARRHPSRCCRPFPHRPQSGPGDLVAELNPHETELNPHEAVPGG